MPIAVITDLPDASGLVLDSGTEDEIGIVWEDTTNYGSYRIEYRETSAGSWTSHATVDQGTTSSVVPNLEDGEEYVVRIRTETEHVTGPWTSQLAVTVLPAATSVAIEDLHWYDPLATTLTWVDNADHVDEAYDVLVSTDGGASFDVIRDGLPAGTTSATFDTDDLAYDTDYVFKVRVRTEHDQTDSGTVSLTTPLPGADGFWLAVVRDDDEWRQVDGDILAADFDKEHTAVSGWSVDVAYDETFEEWLFSEVHLYDGTDYLFRGFLQTAKSDEAAGRTTIGGDGVERTLELDQAAVQYTDEFADVALQDYLDNHSNIGGTVTTPSTTDVVGEALQNADTQSEFESVVSPAPTDPIEVTSSGELASLQTCFVAEGEEEGNVVTDPGFSGGEAGTMAGTFRFTFSTDYTIPEGDVVVAYRGKVGDDGSGGGDHAGFDIELNGTTLESIGDNVLAPGLGWDHWHVGPGDLGGDLEPGTQTVEFDTTGTGDGVDIDVVALYDKRFSYNFDNNNDGAGGPLSGPELYPDGHPIEFEQASSTYNVTEATAQGAFDDTGDGQAIALSSDGGSTWTENANASSVTHTPSVATTTVTGRVTLGRQTVGSPTTTPTTGNAPQALDDWNVTISGDTRGVIADQQLTGDHLSNIQNLCKRGGMRFVLPHARDDGDLGIEAFREGDQTGEATWVAKNRTREVDVRGYANSIMLYGKRDANGVRVALEAPIKNQAEVQRVGEVQRTYVVPEISDVDALRAEARKRLDRHVAEDTVRGTVDIWPENVTPGKSYTITEWDETVALETVKYGFGADGRPSGRLEFVKPGGLGAGISHARAELSEVRDAV